MPLSLKPALDARQVEHIHEHSLDILERVGIDYKTPKAIAALEKLGCPVDYDRTWASIPREVVGWALDQAVRQVRLEARDPHRDVLLDGARSHHTLDSQGTRVIDFETGDMHDSTLVDLEHSLRFADALDRVEIVNVNVSASDVPAHIRTVTHFATAFTQTSKHVRTGVLNADQVPFIIELAKIATGDGNFRPIFSAVDCTISPLMHDGLMTEACIELAKHGVPILMYPMPLAGGTSPVTLAGTILMHNVEFLSGLVLFQGVNPGAPIIYGTGSSQLDMKTGRYGGSANGFGFAPALCQMARLYNLPVNLGGLYTKSESLDAQYGYEAASSCMLAYLSGADEIYSVGLLGSAQILSLEKMVMDNHLIHQIEYMIEPVPMDETHLQAELIERVGVGGEFLTQRETLKYTREEYIPVWPPYGQDLSEMIRMEAEDIYYNHTSPPLPDGAPGRIEEILKEADKALRPKD